MMAYNALFPKTFFFHMFSAAYAKLSSDHVTLVNTHIVV